MEDENIQPFRRSSCPYGQTLTVTGPTSNQLLTFFCVRVTLLEVGTLVRVIPVVSV